MEKKILKFENQIYFHLYKNILKYKQVTLSHMDV